jgi:hypothetical protein
MALAEPGREGPGATNSKKPVRDLSLQEFLRAVVEVLCETRKPEFRYEKQLRLCQFKVWLLSYGSHWKSVRRGGMIYAAAMIGRKMRWLRKKYPDELQGPLLKRTMTISDYRCLFDSVFIYPDTLYNLSECPSFESFCDDVISNKKHIQDLNELTHWRLKIAVTRGLTTALNKAYNAYDAKRAREDEENKKRGIIPDKEKRKLSKHTISNEHEFRGSREPFLFVAYNSVPGICEVASTPTKMLALLDKQVEDPELFRNYFGRCQSVLSFLQIDTPSAGTLQSWSGAERVPLDDVLPIPEEEQDWLGVKESQRRSAKQTAKALRQSPLS